MLRKFAKKRIVVVLGAVAALALAASAFAFFSSTNTSTASGLATVGSQAGWTITWGSVSGGPLLPGNVNPETLTYSVVNNSGSPQQLNGVTATLVEDGYGDITQSGSDVWGCYWSWFAFGSNPPSPQTVPAYSSVSGTVTLSLSESYTNQNACENASPDINVTTS